jgi:hypothetical protein
MSHGDLKGPFFCAAVILALDIVDLVYGTPDLWRVIVSGAVRLS